MKARRRYALAPALLAVAAFTPLADGAGSSTPTPPSWVHHGKYAPVIDKANFVARIDNRYFPLEPGTVFRYRGLKDSARQIDEVTVTHQVKRVLGIKCTVVRDVVSQAGKKLELTYDWYAQDKQGNVWYMGEAAFDRQNGRFVRAKDSWEAGVKNAKPGIIMRGDARPGDVYRQEYYPPDALDQAHVGHASATVSVPAGTYKHALVTDEWSPVEPQIERKWYAAGVGEIKEKVTAGGHEVFRLASVRHAP